MPTKPTMKLLAVSLSAALLALTAFSQSSSNGNNENPIPGVFLNGDDVPFPGFRYVLWSAMSADRRALAATVGWHEASWNFPGSNATVEGQSHDVLTETQKLATQGLGFTEDSFDCFVNHYENYDWVELVQDGIAADFETLGWTNASWTGEAPAPPSEDKDWVDLTDEEQQAAYSLCYFEGTWDGLTIAQMDVPVVEPEIRYQPWSALTASQQAFATAAGWDETTWNNIGTADHESTSWEDLTLSQQHGLTSLGFYEDQYDCYIHHYEDYDWAELVQYNVSEHLETLGWTQAMWEGGTETPASDDKDWSQLTVEEQAAAEELCYDQDLWNEVPLVGSGAAVVAATIIAKYWLGVVLTLALVVV